MEILLSGTAAVIHTIAAILSLRLIFITGRYTAWILLAAGIALAAIRRAITFSGHLDGSIQHLNLFDDAIALAISIFFLAGLIWITPLFVALRNSREALEYVNDKLSLENEASTMLIGELKDAMAKVKLLSGLLPICAACKKIRDDEGYWKQIEVYIREHSDADFSHGICPDCFKDYFPGVSFPDEEEESKT